jgi:nitric oxide synthase-interacting protein
VVGRGTKRKFELDASAIDTLAREAEEAAARQIEREQAEALKAKLPDFWLPSLMPTAGTPRSLSEIKVQSACRGGNPAHALTYVLYEHLVAKAHDE